MNQDDNTVYKYHGTISADQWMPGWINIKNHEGNQLATFLKSRLSKEHENMIDTALDNPNRKVTVSMQGGRVIGMVLSHPDPEMDHNMRELFDDHKPFRTANPNRHRRNSDITR